MKLILLLIEYNLKKFLCVGLKEQRVFKHLGFQINYKWFLNNIRDYRNSQ